MRAGIPTLTLLLAAPLALGAGPLNKRLVAADATWVIHVDLEAAVASSLGKLALEDDEAKEGLRELRLEFGVDLLKDVKGVTVWGEEAEGEDAVIVVQTTAVVDDLLEQFREEAGIEEIEAGGYEILKWSDGGETQYGHIRKTRHGDDRIVFIARNEDDLVRGLEVADGDEPSASSDESIIRDKPGDGAIVFISVPEISTLVPGEALEDIPAIFGKIQGLRFEAGERGDEMFADAAVTTSTSEDASMVQQAAQGLLAMGRLIASGEPEAAELMKFAEGLQISAKDRTVTVALRCKTDDVREALERVRDNHRHDRVKVKVEKEVDEDVDEDKDDEDSPVAAPEKPRRKRGG